MTISPDESVSKVSFAEAAKALKTGVGRVKVNEQLVLQTTGGQLVCDVLVDGGSAWRCEHEFEVLVENARLALRASAFNPFMPELPQLWRVVEMQEGAITVLWPSDDAPS